MTFAACSPFEPSITSTSTCAPSDRERKPRDWNRAGVDEHILAAVSRDEAKAFRIVEPLDGSGLTTHLRNSRKGPGNPSTGKLFREIHSFLEGTTSNYAARENGQKRRQTLSRHANLLTKVGL